MTGTSDQEERGHSFTEIHSALQNYDIILKEAANPDLHHNLTRQLRQTIFGLYIPGIKDMVLPPLNKAPYENIIKNIHSEIDRLNRSYNSEGIKSSTIPRMSPIILLLKLAQEKNYPPPSSKKKQKQRPKVRENDQKQKRKEKEYRRKWGRTAPFKAYLDALHLHSCQGHYKKVWARLPGCILSLVPVWTSHPPVITVSKDSFPANESLARIALDKRDAQLRSLVQSCALEVQKAIRKLQTASSSFQEKYEACIRGQQGTSEVAHEPETELPEDAQESQKTEEERYVTEDKYITLVEDADVEPIHFPGILATWAPSGGYMSACLLDYWRFRTLRPQEAELLDHTDWKFDNKRNEWLLKKKAYGVTSCAERAALIELSAQRDVKVTSPVLW